MATTTPFTIQGYLRYPPDDGAADADRSYSYQGTFTHKIEQDLVLTGAGTHVVDFGTLLAGGAKAVLVEVAAAAAGDTPAPINLRFNSGTDDIEVSQGGFMAFGSPNPTAGLLAMSVIYTQNAQVKVRVLG